MGFFGVLSPNLQKKFFAYFCPGGPPGKCGQKNKFFKYILNGVFRGPESEYEKKFLPTFARGGGAKWAHGPKTHAHPQAKNDIISIFIYPFKKAYISSCNFEIFISDLFFINYFSNCNFI